MIERCREDFPTLQGDNPPAYLDNACVTLKPKSVIDAITDYYTQTPGCGGRSVHRYGTKVSKTVADARKKLGAFLNAEQTNEVVFTRNATHSINQIAHGLQWSKGDVVLTSDRERPGDRCLALVQVATTVRGSSCVPSHEDNTFDLEAFEAMCADAGNRLRMVAMSHVGNLDGVSIPIKEVTKIAHDHGALVAIDGAQSTPHMNVDVQALDIDFLSFSIHKEIVVVIFGKESKKAYGSKKDCSGYSCPY